MPKIKRNRSRVGFTAAHLLLLLLCWLCLRCVLYVTSTPTHPLHMEMLIAFISGFQRDLLVALVLTAPLLAWTLFAPDKWENSRVHRSLFWTSYFVFWSVFIFTLFVEFFFFDEFKSRFNT